MLITALLWCANKCASPYHTECRNSLFNTHNLPQNLYGVQQIMLRELPIKPPCPSQVVLSDSANMRPPVPETLLEKPKING